MHRDSYNEKYFKIDKIFSFKNKQESLEMIEDYDRVWMRIPGTRGNTGRKIYNHQTKLNQHFDFGDNEDEETDEDFTEEQKEVLSNLEQSIKNETNL